jgi:hypothetical protein
VSSVAVKTPMQYLDKATTALRDLGIMPAKVEDAPINALLHKISDLDEDKIAIIARTLGQTSVFNEVVREQTEAMSIGQRYQDIAQGFNSIQQLHNPNAVGNLHTRSHHPLLVITQLSADKRLIYELKPNVDMSFGGNKLLTNSVGFRADREFKIEKAPGVKRIIGVGDSGMWGWSVEQNEGYMEILEKELNSGRESPRAEVLNLAVPGYNTFQEFVSLELKGLAYKPDIVVIGWCENDFQLPFFMYTRKDHWKQKKSYVFNLLFDRSAFMEIVSPEVLKKDDIPKDTVDPDVITHSGQDGVRKTLEQFRQLSEQENFKVLLFGPLKEDIRKLCDAAGIRYINTYDLMETNPPSDCGVFFMHPRPCGHEILGRFLAQRLTELGWME